MLVGRDLGDQNITVGVCICNSFPRVKYYLGLESKTITVSAVQAWLPPFTPMKKQSEQRQKIIDAYLDRFQLQLPKEADVKGKSNDNTAQSNPKAKKTSNDNDRWQAVYKEVVWAAIHCARFQDHEAHR
jgi:hypothetical protein